ncbi:HNH endonuclease [Thermodesulfobacteriota bacterium]
MKKALEKYTTAFTSLNVGRVGDHLRPHKPVLLLAVLDLIESGRISDNRIELSPELLEHFGRYFEVVRATDDKPTPINPFFHLRGDKFWHHKPHPGMEQAYQTMKSPGGTRALNEVIDCATLDDELHDILQVRDYRETLRKAIIERYFPGHRERLLEIIREEREIGGYEQILEHSLDDKSLLKDTLAPQEPIRNAAFRRVVVIAYDYRCAACGLRIILADGPTIVDAAHIIPFRESRDDDPRNGMALCKNHHWAMDRNLIAPGTDHAWHVSGSLDDRLEGQRDLLSLQKRTIILPREAKYHPKQEALAWRQRNLIRS